MIRSYNKNFLYLFGLFLAEVLLTFQLTELGESQPTTIKVVLVGIWFSLVLILLKIIFFTKYTINEIIFWTILFLLLFFVSLNVHNINLIYIAILVLGSVNVDFDKILRVHIFAQIGVIVLTLIMVKMGWIINLVYLRDNTLRYSWGFTYPTAFSATLFTVFLSIVVLKRFQLSKIDYSLSILLTYFIIVSLNARLDGILMFIVIIFCIFQKYILKIVRRIGPFFISCTNFILIFGSVLMSYFYNPYNPLLYKINNIFSQRLSLGHIALTNYKITLFGQQVEMNGFGGLKGLQHQFSIYFYIDNLFIQVLVILGVVAFILLVIFFVWMPYKWYKDGKIILELLVGIICVASLVEDSFMAPANNFILMAIVANTDNFVYRWDKEKK